MPTHISCTMNGKRVSVYLKGRSTTTEENIVRKALILASTAVMMLACQTLLPASSPGGNYENPENDQVCYSEQNLTDQECNNAGTHRYASAISVSGIGGTDCSADDGSTYLEGYSTYTFSFFGKSSLEYSHPEELVWDSYTHNFSETGRNTYEFSGSLDGMNTVWEVTFYSWGFQEELTLTWECENGTCGCITTGEFDLSD